MSACFEWYESLSWAAAYAPLAGVGLVVAVADRVLAQRWAR